MMINPFRPEYGTQAPGTPSTFAPSVAEGEEPLSPATSPWVRPMKNSAPGEIEQTGQALSEAGAFESKLGETIGDRVQETMDAANVRNADTAFMTAANDIVARYTHSLGSDAVGGYQPAQQAILKAKQDAAAGLTNPIQQHMFAQMATPRLVEFGKQLSDHEFQQRIQVGTQAANDRSDSLIQQAANSYSDWQRPDGKFAGNKMMAIHEAQEAGLLLGQPVDSPQSQALVKQKTSALAQGVLTRMMDKEQYDEAQQYYSKALAAGEIDERTAEMLGNAVMEGHNSQKGALLANGARQIGLGAPDASQQRLYPVAGGSITSTMGAPRPDGRTHDGIDIATPVGTNVQAPANGTVSRVWNDDKFGGGLSMEITYPNGNVEGFAHLSAVNYKPGQEVTQGSVVALTGKSGDATGPVLHWAMKDKDGNWIDPRSSVPAPRDTDNFTEPEQLEKGLAYISASGETDRVQDIAIAKLRSMYGLARELQEQKYQEAKQNAVNWLVQNNGNYAAMPANLKMPLNPGDAEAFQQNQEDAQKKASTLALRVQWQDHPYDPTNPPNDPDQMSVANVDEAYAKHLLTDEAWQQLRQKAVDMQNDPQKAIQAKIDEGQLNNVLEMNQLGNLAHPKTPDDYQEKATLATNIQNEIQRQENAGKRPLTWQEKGKIARDMVTDKVYTSSPHFYSGVTGGLMPLAAATQQQQQNATVWVGSQKVRMADIPPQYSLQATEELKAIGQPATQTQIAAWWLRKKSQINQRTVSPP